MQRLLALLLVLALLPSCASFTATSTSVVNVTQVAIRDSHDALDALERSDRDAALAAATDEATARAATSAVLARYSVVWDRYDQVRAAWLLAHASVQAMRLAQASGGNPNVVATYNALAALATAWEGFAAVLPHRSSPPTKTAARANVARPRALAMESHQ